jgi:AmpD protein
MKNPALPYIIHTPLKHYDTRPAEVSIDTIVIHSLYAPESPTPFSAKACHALLDHYKVAAHYLIDRKGGVYELVAPEHRAWHAGVSKMPSPSDGRTGVNDFSIGIELIGSLTSGYTRKQYRSLVALITRIKEQYQITAIVGHDEIAPERKSDPGGMFEWGWVR